MRSIGTDNQAALSGLIRRQNNQLASGIILHRKDFFTGLFNQFQIV